MLQLCYTLHVNISMEKFIVSTTTVRITEDLKERLARAAQRAGLSSHALIVEAIAERIEAEERRNALAETAEDRYDIIMESGRTIPWSEMRSYLERRIDGSEASRPKARKLAR